MIDKSDHTSEMHPMRIIILSYIFLFWLSNISIIETKMVQWYISESELLSSLQFREEDGWLSAFYSCLIMKVLDLVTPKPYTCKETMDVNCICFHCWWFLSCLLAWKRICSWSKIQGTWTRILQYFVLDFRWNTEK